MAVIFQVGGWRPSMQKMHNQVELVHLVLHYTPLTTTSAIKAITSRSEDFNICNIPKYPICATHTPPFQEEAPTVWESAIWSLRPQDLIFGYISKRICLKFFHSIKYYIFSIYTSSENFGYSKSNIWTKIYFSILIVKMTQDTLYSSPFVL